MHIRLLIVGILAALGTQPESCTIPATGSEYSANDSASQSREFSPLVSEYEKANKVETCSKLLDLPPRGIACLHCLHPRASVQGDVLVETVRSSCLKRNAINYLVDGSFSSNLGESPTSETAESDIPSNRLDESVYAHDRDVILKHVDALTASERELYLHIYLLNGPAQRRYKSNHGRGLFTYISPSEFRNNIVSDSALQNRFAEHVQGLMPLFVAAAGKGAVISIVPMLEDNLDLPAFLEMVRIIDRVIGGAFPYSIVRNPCPRCSKGADSEIPAGCFKEGHSLSSANKISDGVITNDGQSDLTKEELQTALRGAGSNRNVFIIWDAARQGLKEISKGRFARVIPDERNYKIPDPNEVVELKTLLRY